MPGDEYFEAEKPKSAEGGVVGFGLTDDVPMYLRAGTYFVRKPDGEEVEVVVYPAKNLSVELVSDEAEKSALEHYLQPGEYVISRETALNVTPELIESMEAALKKLNDEKPEWVEDIGTINHGQSDNEPND
jgi:hypothetical protein